MSLRIHNSVEVYLEQKQHELAVISLPDLPEADDGHYLINLNEQNDGRIFSWVKLVQRLGGSVAAANPITDQIPLLALCGVQDVVVTNSDKLTLTNSAVEHSVRPYSQFG